MKLCRFEYQNSRHLGIVRDDVIAVTDDQLNETGVTMPIGKVEFLLPVSPSKIVCVGRNYADHAKELGNDIPTEPLLFLKAPSALVAHGEAIVIPGHSTQVEHEAELGIVIGRDCSMLADTDNVSDHILGFLPVNDVTARDLQRKDVQFTRAKSFDTFCPVGRFIETDIDVADVEVACTVNDEVRQAGRTSQMIFDVEFLVRYISRQMTLKRGDLIATGTPAGVSRLVPGDICEVRIEGFEKLSNPIAAAPELSQPAER